MGGAADPWAAPQILKWGYKTGFASGASKKFCTPLFQMWGTSKKISVGTIEYTEICCLVVALINIDRRRQVAYGIMNRGKRQLMN